jgi:hypothetical protein
MTELVVPLAIAAFRRRRKKDKPVRELYPARIARALALAHALQARLDAGEFRDYAEMAKALGFTRGRVTQVMDLLLLAPDIQEEILFLPASQSGRDAITLRHLQPIARVPFWTKQRRLWHQLKRQLVQNAPAQRQYARILIWCVQSP